MDGVVHESESFETSLVSPDTMTCTSIAPTPSHKNLALTSETPSTNRPIAYDMSVVPQVHRNAIFLRRWRELSLEENKWLSREHRRNPYVNRKAKVSSTNRTASDVLGVFQETFLDHQACMDCLTTFDFSSFTRAEGESRPTAFSAQNSTSPPLNESVIWIPPSREDWEECLIEMNALCTEAFWRTSPTAFHKNHILSPITAAYIKERLNIDDPLRGYQIRHAKGGWLQGFVTMTNFTVWNDLFSFDSYHPKNGIHFSNSKQVDMGSLAIELNQQSREGDSTDRGVIFPSIAEISVVGALGCGEYLIQMALDDISRRGNHDFVILDATESSSGFYEKFGFVRVGAICKYGDNDEVVGYRHWTYPNQDSSKFEKDGVMPSCLMARRIARRSPSALGKTCLSCGRNTRPSFLDELSPYFVSCKPQVLNTDLIYDSTSTGKRSNSPTEIIAASNKKMNIEKLGFKNTHTDASVTKTKSLTCYDSPLECDTNVSKAPYLSQKANSSVVPQDILKRFFYTASNRSNPQVTILLKQRRNMRVSHCDSFVNKVVTPKNDCTKEWKYFFVVHSDDQTEMMYVTPLYPKGKVRNTQLIKYHAKISPTSGIVTADTCWNTMRIQHVSYNDWRIVQSKNVYKSADIDRERWIICE